MEPFLTIWSPLVSRVFMLGGYCKSMKSMVSWKDAPARKHGVFALIVGGGLLGYAGLRSRMSARPHATAFQPTDYRTPSLNHRDPNEVDPTLIGSSAAGSTPEDSIWVLTYNVCWGCMTGSKQDKSARELAERCGKSDVRPTPCLRQVAENIDAISSQTRSTLSFVGLQEATGWQELQRLSSCLGSLSVLVNKVNSEEIALFYDSSFFKIWTGVGDVSGRPLQVAVFSKLNRYHVIVHVHNNHRAKGTRDMIQSSLMEMPGLQENLQPIPADALLICLGDWNDPSGAIPGFAPFLKCNIPLRHKTVSYEDSLPKSCCSTRRNPTHMHSSGDYVLSSASVRNEIPMVSIQDSSGLIRPYVVPDASDHLPVLAEVTFKARSATTVPLFPLSMHFPEPLPSYEPVRRPRTRYRVPCPLHSENRSQSCGSQ